MITPVAGCPCLVSNLREFTWSGGEGWQPLSPHRLGFKFLLCRLLCVTLNDLLNPLTCHFHMKEDVSHRGHWGVS